MKINSNQGNKDMSLIKTVDSDADTSSISATTETSQ